MNARPTLDSLFAADDFISRHIGPSAAEQQHMLRTVGAASMDELLEQTVPSTIRLAESLGLPGPRSVEDVLGELRAIASRNRPRTSLIGMGYYGTHVPPVIQRNVLENPAWYTAYTPYQPEISQGRLEAILNYQTMVASLTGMELANASLLDEATAAAEAMTMARRASKAASKRFLVHHDVHPQTLAVLNTRAEPLGIEVAVDASPAASFTPADCFGVLLSLPTSTGAMPDWRAAIAAAHAAGAVVVVATDLLACTIATPPGALGADIAIGSAQRFGVPMGFGGPHAAFMATSEALTRSMPGRLVGVSTDTEGRPALRLALQTREQHIRREKATSNICTAQVLLANMAGMYACWHGPDGLRRIADRVQRLASLTAAALRAAGFTLVHDSWFDTLAVECDADAVLAAARADGLDLRRLDERHVAFSFDETTTVEIVRRVLAQFDVKVPLPDDAPDGLTDRRSDEILTQAVFHRYHSEHEMLRYLRRLADKDLALDRTMIPLGSCTMKLNAAAEMMPVTWPEFGSLHPFAPDDESAGYRELIGQLEAMLVAVTGYDAVSLQPNAGSQGEFAGLLAIRAYHHSRGDTQRTVCLI
ncbi:MAG TPA: glycine dehydrogenase (aminomethyl-transferring), partial [Ilumatobacteraceae bacterium]|nr:glycine dehydrogenase (aminomethyl-transferring) [Ilumatobacteraceae bacterium]